MLFPTQPWFEYKSDDSFEYDELSLMRARTYIHTLLDELLSKGTHIRLAGYSQGACLALDSALTYQRTLDVFACSGFVMDWRVFDTMEKYDNLHEGINLWWSHGTNDSIVDARLARKSYDLLGYTKGRLLHGYDHWGMWADTAFVRHFQKFVLA